LRQAKTGRRVNIPVTRRLRSILDNSKRSATVILTNKRGMAWQPNAFRKAWGDACRKAKISGLTFHDLRGTAVTRLAEAECSHPEIAAITGHSMRDVGAILDKYLAAPTRSLLRRSPSLKGARHDDPTRSNRAARLQEIGRRTCFCRHAAGRQKSARDLGHQTAQQAPPLPDI
jgi:hypothetical protein